MEIEHAAVIGSSGRDKGFAAALDLVLGELGFTSTGPATLQRWPRTAIDLEVSYITPVRGAWACLGVPPAMARAVTSRVATRLAHPLQLYTATARYDDRTLDCTVEDWLVRVDGTALAGTFARQLDDEFRDNWGEICDAKPYFAMTALIDAALDAWVTGTRDVRATRWAPPPSLGDRRLDELALRIRSATKAQVMTVDGRPCVRVTTADNATTTSFLTDDELERLEPAVAALLR